MDRDSQKIAQVEASLDRTSVSIAMEMNVTMNEENQIKIYSKRVGGPDPSCSLEKLERNADISRARYIYATEKLSEYNAKVSEWQHILRKRQQDFNDCLITYYKKKLNLTDKDLEEPMDQDCSGLYIFKKEGVE